MTKRIPVSAAKKVADQYDLSQCLLIGFDGDKVHLVTYGKTKEDCKLAAKAQEFWEGKIREFSFRGEQNETSRADTLLAAINYARHLGLDGMFWLDGWTEGDEAAMAELEEWRKATP